MKRNKATFSKILEQAELKNSQRLMAKARLANRLAKKSRGANRQTAYRIKATALCSLVKRLPHHVRVFKDIKLTDFVIVELNREPSGLHLPFANLSLTV